MAEQEEKGGVRQAANELRHDVSREKIDHRLDEFVSDRPLVRHFLDPGVALRAAGIALLAALVVWLLLSAQLAAVVLVLGFLAAWTLMANRQYEQRRETQPSDGEAPAGA